MDDDLDEDLLALRQLELTVMAQEMALIAKRLGASNTPEAAAQIERLEYELVRTRASHAATWRRIAGEQRRRYRGNLALFTGLGLGLIGLAFAATSGSSRA